MRRVGRVGGAVALSLVLMWGASGCSSDSDKLTSPSCTEREAQDWEPLKELARTTLEGLDVSSYERLSTCEDTGDTEAGAVVVADVRSWESREQADEGLARRGWVKVAYSEFVAGPYQAHVVMHPEDDDKAASASIYFSRP